MQTREGNDRIDQDQNGLPDCAFPPDYNLIPVAWKCAANKVAICKVDKNNNVRQTICVSKNAVTAQVNASNHNYCGPCNESACISMAGVPKTAWVRNLDFQVFPNPAYRMVDIRIEGRAASNSKLVLTDLLGRQIWKQKLYEYDQSVRLDLPLLGIQPGIYLLTAWIGEETVSKKLVVK